jgi:glyoxalase family protein
MKLSGIHHITAIAADPQENYNFYTGALKLRFIKKTVNFDDPFTYHLYYGDETGNPGTVLTFFPWGKSGFKGSRGAGQLTTTMYSVSSSSYDFWKDYLAKQNISVLSEETRFNDQVIVFEDQDGFQNELIFNDDDERTGFQHPDVPDGFSIKGFFGAAASYHSIVDTEEFIKLLNFKLISEDENRKRYSTGGGEPGSIMDLLKTPEVPSGRMGAGAVHHIAWRAKDENRQLEFQKLIRENGFHVTDVVERNYFKSIYFREPGGVLFEIATDSPGFLIDESKEELGKDLKLPPWHEPKRKEIEAALPPLNT